MVISLMASLCMSAEPVAAVSSENANFYAHRGLSAKAPDNTMAAFRLAVKAGFYGIDCDLWPTGKDKSGKFDIAVSHDNNLRKTAGINRQIRKMTANKVKKIRIIHGKNIKKYPKERIPMVSDFLGLAKANGMHAIVEMKGKNWSKAECNKLLKEISKAGMLNKTIVNSLYINNLKTFQNCAKKYSKRPKTMYTIVTYQEMDKKLKACVKAGIPIASMRSSHIIAHRKAVFKAYRKNGIRILSWTAGEASEKKAAEKLIKYGVKSIVTDTKVFK